METWQKAAGIIPICVRLASVVWGDRYQDTGEGARSMVGPLSFTLPCLTRGQGWPQHGAGARLLSWHISCPSESPPVSPHSPHASSLTEDGTFQMKGKVERVMLSVMNKRMCEKVSVCSHGITVSQPVTVWLMTNTQLMREEVGKPVARDDCMNWSALRAIIILTV